MRNKMKEHLKRHLKPVQLKTKKEVDQLNKQDRALGFNHQWKLGDEVYWMFFSIK